jgi:acyl-CoA thioesterase-1
MAMLVSSAWIGAPDGGARRSLAAPRGELNHCHAWEEALMRAATRAVATAGFAMAIGVSPVAAADPAYIVALGASGIHGKGVPLDQAYPAQLETLLRARGFDVHVINAGIDGDTTTGMLYRMDATIPSATKIVIFQPGTNDFRRRRGVGTDDHLANIETIIGRLRGRQIGVVVCSDGAAEAAAAQRYNAVAMSCNDAAHLIDGQHLDLVGHRIVAERLLPVIEGMLRQR